MKTCTISGCERKYLAKGWCVNHYHQNRLHGDPLVYAHRPTLAERLWSKVDKSGDCWIWTATKSGGGYGMMKDASGKSVGAHRLAYEDAYGPIPKGMHIDHRCHVKLCCNPAHLRVATQKQNMEHLTEDRVNSSTGFRNVYRHGNRYRVKVGHNGQRVHGGHFATIEEAAEAAKALRLSLYTHNDLDRISA